MFQQQRFNPLSQFALLLAMCGGGFILTGLLTGLIGQLITGVSGADLYNTLIDPKNKQLYRLLQVFGSFFMWGVPALLVTYLSGSDPARGLGFNENANSRQFLVVFFIAGTGLLMSGALGELNKLIPLSHTLKTYFDGLEDKYNEAVIGMADMKSVEDFIVSVLVLAIVPAIFEEMLFRGCLQQIMVRLTRHAFAGIFVTSFIFSIIHGSFYGFLPRLFLGLMLGYIFYLSKNIWLSITAHFLNNVISVIQMYSLSRTGKLTKEVFEETFPWYLGLAAAIILYFLFRTFKKESEYVLSNAGAGEEQNNTV